ncbi:hypothetical protein JHK84_053093 [Glycine max]|nr:hypothetical protein JHK84_053093 [Glycine max]
MDGSVEMVHQMIVKDMLIHELTAATTHNLSPTLPRPLIFHPFTKTWSFDPSLSTPRRWCVLGSLGPTVYVANGISFHFSIHVTRSLQNLEKFTHKTNEALASMHDLAMSSGHA